MAVSGAVTQVGTMFGYRTPRLFLAMLLPVVLFLACSQDENGPQPPVKVQGLPSKEEMFRLLKAAGMKVQHFIDETGFYFLLGEKR